MPKVGEKVGHEVGERRGGAEGEGRAISQAAMMKVLYCRSRASVRRNCSASISHLFAWNPSRRAQEISVFHRIFRLAGRDSDRRGRPCQAASRLLGEARLNETCTRSEV